MAESVFPWAYRDGVLIPYEQLNIHAESMAMRYALSVFEGVRGYLQHDKQTVCYFALDEHLERLSQTLALTKLPALMLSEVESVATQLLDANNVHVDCYLRIAVNATSLGTLKDPVCTELFATIKPMGRKIWLASGTGMSVSISQRRKPSDEVFPQRAKVICNYAGPRLAYLDTFSHGFDEVILKSSEGLLSEAPTANLFLILDGCVVTPRLQDGILGGITREYVMRLCQTLGWQVEERGLTPEDASRATEAFLCGTAIELAPIYQFDDHPLPRNQQLFPRLVEAYFNLVRGLPIHGGLE